MLKKTNRPSRISGGLDAILDSKAKVKLLTFFAGHGFGFKVTGRQAACQSGISAPSAHAALKDLYSLGILHQEIIGRQHIYSLNQTARIVKDILLPAFKKDFSLKKDIKDFLLKKIDKLGLKHKISSLVFYGSFQNNSAGKGSDVDVAVVVKSEADADKVGDVFLDKIYPSFYEYFGAHLDAYVKSYPDFVSRLKKKQPPLSTLLDSYSVIYGQDPKEMIVK
jgi:predicted nucleotidyltransferase